MIDWLLNFIWTAIPLWVWFIIGGVALGAAWKTFGWQGVMGGLVALVTLGIYRKGYRDAAARNPPLVPVKEYPVEDYERAIIEPAQPNKPRRNIWSVQDILRGRND